MNIIIIMLFESDNKNAVVFKSFCPPKGLTLKHIKLTVINKNINLADTYPLVCTIPMSFLPFP